MQVSLGPPASAADVATSRQPSTNATPSANPSPTARSSTLRWPGSGTPPRPKAPGWPSWTPAKTRSPSPSCSHHADQAELSNPDYQRELRNWRRTEPATDGIPTSALPEAGERHTEVPVRDFTAGDPDPGRPATDPAATPRDERPALLILGTDADSPTQWLHAGQALSALLLDATTAGLRASMLGQVIDLPATRAQLRTLLRLIGEPQMVLRIGYGPAAPATPRRPLTEILSESN